VLDNGDGHHDYWAFTTGNLFPILHSSDLVHWTSAGTAMTARPAWVLQTGDWHPWSPNVVAVPRACPGTSSPSCYLMYYVGLSTKTRANCVAVATSTTPGGPYLDRGPLSDGTLDASHRPLGCGDEDGYGMIDPSLFVDPGDGRSYLYVSEDFGCPPPSTSCTAANGVLRPTISVIPLTSDYLRASGPRTPLFSGDGGTWESADVPVPTVEGPSALLHDGTYYLLYSGGNWRSAYAMGYATAASPTGPFTKASINPILSRTATVLSPGGADGLLIGPSGGTWLAYHARAGSYSDPRTLRMDPFSWRSEAPAPDAPEIAGPTSTPQPREP
jgi:beta-xylosidase